jgi:hypothetical protein
MTERRDTRSAESTETGSFSRGEPVIDREDDDPSEGIVILTPKATIADWEIRIDGGERTIAETNPEYDPEEPVVLVTYEHWLDESWPEWETSEPEDLFDSVCDRGVKFYSFPASRLERDPARTPVGDREPGTEDEDSDSEEGVTETERASEWSDESVSDEEDDDPGESDEEPPEEPTWDPPEWILDLKARLSESTSVSLDPEREVLRIEKLGEHYSVDAEGEIEGDGALRTRLEPVVGELYEDE